MNISLIQFTGLLTLGALYLPVIFLAVQRREEDNAAANWLAAGYSLLAMILTVVEAVWRNGGNSENSAASFQEFQIHLSLTLVFVLMLALQAFLRRESWKVWAGVWGIWTFILALTLVNAFRLPDTLWSDGSLTLERGRLAPAWSILGWLTFLVGLIVAVTNGGRESRQQLFRNRLNYWWFILLLVFINDALLFSNFLIPGQPLRLLIAALTAYVIGTHNVPDLKHVLRRAFVYVVMAASIAGLYAGGTLLLQALFKGIHPLLAGGAIALFLTAAYAPLMSRVSRTVNNWTKGDQYDASRTIHQYSESISNILDMDRLASIAVGIILEAMQIERGFLFLVDGERQADGRKLYRLRSARSPEERQMVAAELDENGAIASYFVREQRPLLQYDLDLLPAYRSASPFEREWFSRLRAEVYIPIFAKRQWIGLLAFGPKLSGNRYTDEDLVTLSAHASQTAVALENARLVDNLMRLNNELRQARRALEKNNRDLERIDQAKSDFISIASHELRTPLTVIKGYSEMMLEDPSLDPNLKSVMQKIHEGALRLHEVMDSMFDIAQLDARTLKPHLQPVDLGNLIKEVSIEQAEGLKERAQSLTVNLPNLPLVKADPNLLRKLFQRLIQNAIKFTPNQGKITVTGRGIPPMAELPSGGVELVFSDTGVGVDPTFHEIIFTKFYQPGELGKHSTSKTRFKGGGAGLGLALSKSIVEAHGGRIYVESPGYDEINFPGSQFHVILPLGRLEGNEKQKISQPLKFQM
jgi:signal transduction histidine kinase